MPYSESHAFHEGSGFGGYEPNEVCHKTMLFFFPSKKVFDWLGEDSDGAPYYLRPLNLNWGGEGPEHDLAKFSAVSQRLACEHAYWSRIIRTRSWRHTLVGCVCVILARPEGFFEDLSYRFRGGSFVSPQICMTLGIVYPDETISFLTKLLESGSRWDADYKQIESAEMVLERLGSTLLRNTKICDLNEQQHYEASIAEAVIERQWGFWVENTGKTQFLD